MERSRPLERIEQIQAGPSLPGSWQFDGEHGDRQPAGLGLLEETADMGRISSLNSHPKESS
jgi:hypothetical protein